MKKLLGILVLGLLWCSVGFAACIKGDCNNGYGTFTRADGIKYVGEWENESPNGLGTFTYEDGNKYVGEVQNGDMHGQGTYIYANGDIYVGEYLVNERNGEGTYTLADGSIKSGLWYEDKLVTNTDEIEITKYFIEDLKRLFRDAGLM